MISRLQAMKQSNPQPSKVRWSLHVLSFLLAACTALFSNTATWSQQSTPQPPSILFGELYAQVALSGVIADTKTFTDAVPKYPPEEILKAYRQAHPTSDADLKSFVEQNFNLAPVPSGDKFTTPDKRSIREHIESLWPVLTRQPESPPQYSTLLPLPYPYVVPGGRFEEIYYWDSYFTLLGVSPDKHRDIIESMVKNIAYMIDTYGHMPNGNRTYYLSRSQPPFFFKVVSLLAPNDEASAFAQYLPQLRAEYTFWMEGEKNSTPGSSYKRVVSMPDGSVLNRYWDERDAPRDESFRADVLLSKNASRDTKELYRDIRAAAESGWDFSSRWFADGRHLETIQTTDIVPIDLNSILYGLEQAIRAGCVRKADRECSDEFTQRAARRRMAINRYLWSAKTKSYQDYQWVQKKPTGQLSAAIVYPLFFGAADRQQAGAVAKIVNAQLLKPGGLVTTPINTGQQWDAPNGWAPLQWLAVDGLNRYGHRTLAQNIAERWMNTVLRTYQRSGKLVEKYDVVNIGQFAGGGEYPLQDGFGWSNGVMIKLMDLYAFDQHQPVKRAAGE